jgi:hypothetical protein
MLVEGLPTMEDVASSFEAGRQRRGGVDPMETLQSVLTSTRGAIPEGWADDRRQRRWSWVAAIITGSTLLGVALFMAPTFQRCLARAIAFRKSNLIGEPPATDLSQTADDTNILTVLLSLFLSESG